MKIRLAALLTALLLLLTACAAPAPESQGAPSSPSPESEGTSPPSLPEGESSSPFPVPEGEESVPPSAPASAAAPRDYYIEDENREAIEDLEAVKALCGYLEEHLDPKDYGWIDWGWSSPPWRGEEEDGPDIPKDQYWVVILAPDKAPVDALLKDYDGPWAPVLFEQNDITLADTAQAEKDLWAFLAEHPEIEVMGFENSEAHIVLDVAELNDELTAFVENYPIQGVYFVYSSAGMHPD